MHQTEGKSKGEWKVKGKEKCVMFSENPLSKGCFQFITVFILGHSKTINAQQR